MRKKIDVLPLPWIVRSEKDVHYISRLVTDAIEVETLGTVSLRFSADRVLLPKRGIIQRVTVISDENRAWEIVFFKSAISTLPLTTDADLDAVIQRVSFEESDGKQVAGAGNYRYSCTSLNIGYYNTDAPGQLHVGLVNRSVAAKSGSAKLPPLPPPPPGYAVIEIQGITYS